MLQDKYILWSCFLISFVSAGTGSVDVTLLTCNDNKTITLTVANAEGYYVTIVGCAEEQQISGGMATLSNCSLSWDSMYVVQVYENMGVFLDTDYSEGIKCVRSTSDVTVTVQNTFSVDPTDATVTDLVEPTVTMSITTDSAGNNAAGTVAVGTTLYLNLYLQSDFITTDGFDIRAKTIEVVSAGTTVTLTGDPSDGDGCMSQTYWGSVTDMGQGYLQIAFNAFMIVTGTSELNTQLFTATLEVCASTACSNYTCPGGRKKRAITDVSEDQFKEEILEDVKVQGALVVQGIPFESVDGEDSNTGTDIASQSGDTMCVAKTTFYGISAFCLVGLVLSVVATCFMFFRTRRVRMSKDDKDYQDHTYSNTSLKSVSS